MKNNMGKMKKGILIGGVLVLLAFITSCSASGPPKIELSANYFDFGDINPDGGIITKTFSVKNTGKDSLKIISISTSCGCTEAEIDSKEILPGKEAKLTVNYDPSVHPGLTGKIKRIVYIKSNDPLNEEIELELVGNSLPSSKSKEINSEGKL